jgi:hypothetical protein
MDGFKENETRKEPCLSLEREKTISTLDEIHATYTRGV